MARDVKFWCNDIHEGAFFMIGLRIVEMERMPWVNFSMGAIVNRRTLEYKTRVNVFWNVQLVLLYIFIFF